jgi:uncharacterized protein (TIGR02145 family)
MKNNFSITLIFTIVVFIHGCKKADDNKVTDIDGNVYNTVTIGSQVWMAENLKTTKYSNGEIIGTTTPVTRSVSVEAEPKYQWASGGIESNIVSYGRLYTWYAATDSRNVCPLGWHVPSDADWGTLNMVIGGESNSLQTLKGKGFTIQFGGWRLDNVFIDFSIWGSWWSTTIENTLPGSVDQAYCRVAGNNGSILSRSYRYKKSGLSIRCLKD